MRQAGFGKLRRRAQSERFDRVTIHRAATAYGRSTALPANLAASSSGHEFRSLHLALNRLRSALEPPPLAGPLRLRRCSIGWL